MSAEESKPKGPDLSAGVPIAQVSEGGMLLGRVGDEAVLLARRGDDIFAVGALCTHYHGPLAEGILVGDTVRCPWHHACFNLRTGEALRAPAFDPVACWRVERRGDAVHVREKLPRAAKPETSEGPESVVIVGGGGAGFAAAEMLRREGFGRPVTILSADEAPPCDRPNLSKDYLAGTAREEWIPLRSPKFYERRGIDLVLGARVVELDVRDKHVKLADGSSRRFGALLLATGAEPVRLAAPGAEAPHVHYLRTFADSRAIIAKAASARRAVVVGASFIGLEVAASLRARKVEVHVVAPEARPMEPVMGPHLGDFIRKLHETNGVVFHLQDTVAAIAEGAVRLKSGTSLPADLVVVGIGVRPVADLAEAAGLAIDRGIAVNEYLETSAPGVFAAGDAARWPDRHSGERLRIEHWVVAERQGQTAARNILGRRERFDAVPFFWSQHYDVVIGYVGHASRWDRIDVDGSIDGRDCTLTFVGAGRALATATIFRDQASLAAEAAMERRLAESG